MSTRRITVTVAQSVEYIHTIEIDEDDYLLWNDGAPDTNEAMREFLEAGDDLCDILADVVASGTAVNGGNVDHEIVCVDRAVS